MSITNKLSVTKGDSCFFTVAVQDKDGGHYDVSGYPTLKFTAKDNLSKDDADAVISAVGTHDPVDNWKINFTLTPDDTRIEARKYTYDVQVSNGAANVHTVIKETEIEITPEVTILP